MMKTIFLFLCMVVSSAMLGQNEASNGLQMQLVETWVNGSWQNSQKGTFTTNDDGYISNVLFEMWNTGTSSWDINRQVTYTSGENTQISTSQNWNGVNWINSSKTTWHYDADTQQAEYAISQLWSDGAWANNSRITNTYNEDGDLTHVLTELWNAGSNDWYVYMQQNYILNDIGQAYIITSQIYNPVSATWADNSRVTNSYTEGALIYSLYEIAPPGWINSSDITRSYDVQGRVQLVLGNIWNTATNSWATSSRITYYYETLGIETHNKDVLAVYPNPANDILTLANIESLKTVSICGIDGRMIFLSPVHNQVDVSMLSAGVYVLAAETEAGRQNIKFIKL